METLLIFSIIIFIGFWIWALLDLAFSTFKNNRWKLAWLIIIVFFPLLGSVLYLLLKKDFKAETGEKRRYLDGQGKMIRNNDSF